MSHPPFLYLLSFVSFASMSDQQKVLNSQILDEAAADVYNELHLPDWEPALTPKRFTQTLAASVDDRCDSVPGEPPPRKSFSSIATQCPHPGAHGMAPLIGAPFAHRCCANAVGSGHRCLLKAFYPHTICATHEKYFARHGRLPPGGAFRPFEPHPDDYWPGPRQLTPA